MTTSGTTTEREVWQEFQQKLRPLVLMIIDDGRIEGWEIGAMMGALEHFNAEISQAAVHSLLQKEMVEFHKAHDVNECALKAGDEKIRLEVTDNMLAGLAGIVGLTTVTGGDLSPSATLDKSERDKDGKFV